MESITTARLSSGESSNSASSISINESGAKNKIKPTVSNESSEIKTNLSKGRIIPSKYKAVALEVSRKGKVGECGILSSLNKSNSFDSKCTNKSSIRQENKYMPKRGLLISSNIRNAPLPNRPFPKVFQHESHFPNSVNGDLIKSNPKLHSTAVNNSTFLDKTECGSPDMFSTTVIGGHKLFEQKLQKNFPSLAELPDISNISPVNVTLPTTGQVVSTSDNIDESTDYSEEEMNAEYLNYLTWALVDTNSEEKFKKQMEESEKQLLFLANLVEEQENALLEERKALALIQHYEEISKDHETMKALLENMNTSVKPCEKALEVITSNLQHQLSKVKLENVHIHLDQKTFEDELNHVLDENKYLLTQINTHLEPGRARDECLAEVIESLNKCFQTATPCIAEVNKLASIIMQETSLSVTFDKINENLQRNERNK